MTKAEALHEFWSGFGLKAYDAYSVPTGDNLPDLPYITYNVQTDSLGAILLLNGSLWYGSSSWKDVEAKAQEIAKAIGENGYVIKDVDGGYVWIKKGNPFAQRMSDEGDRMVRRVYLNITVEFLTAY